MSNSNEIWAFRIVAVVQLRLGTSPRGVPHRSLSLIGLYVSFELLDRPNAEVAALDVRPNLGHEPLVEPQSCGWTAGWGRASRRS